ncbi:MAG: dihydrofolate reductase family protein [Thermoproteota archaeon]|nr:dihydrofolate reductase family protein [Thermoproteota archaeon]
MIRRHIAVILRSFRHNNVTGWFYRRPYDDVERLHDWVFDGKTERTGTSPRTSGAGSNREVLDESFKTIVAANTAVMGSANTSQQYMKAGLFDEIPIHLVPVLLVKISDCSTI